MVAHWMVLMNTKTGYTMANEKVGIFRSAVFVNSQLRNDIDSTISEDTARVIRSWNNTIGQYVPYSENAIFDHEMMSIKSFKSDAIIQNKYNGKREQIMKSYIHITSPIRRLIDLLNQMILFQHLSLVTSFSADAMSFLSNWISQMDYVNTAMRSIRKIQTDCDTLKKCFINPEIMDAVHIGTVFDKIVKNDGSISYMVYLENVRLLSRINTQIDIDNYSSAKFKIFTFEDEDKLRKKIRLQIMN
jgi:hypothetical protein